MTKAQWEIKNTFQNQPSNVNNMHMKKFQQISGNTLITVMTSMPFDDFNNCNLISWSGFTSKFESGSLRVYQTPNTVQRIISSCVMTITCLSVLWRVLPGMCVLAGWCQIVSRCNFCGTCAASLDWVHSNDCDGAKFGVNTTLEADLTSWMQLFIQSAHCTCYCLYL